MPRVKDDAKNKILSAANEILACNGDFTMRQVAKHCDFALGTLYNYYASKAELVIEIVAKMWDSCFDEIRKINNIDFYQSIKEVYDILNKYMKHFSANLMMWLANLPDDGKQLSKSFNTLYIGIFNDLLVEIISKHSDTFDSEAVSVIGEKGLAEFITNHLLDMTTRGGSDFPKFEFLLRKVLT